MKKFSKALLFVALCGAGMNAMAVGLGTCASQTVALLAAGTALPNVKYSLLNGKFTPAVVTNLTTLLHTVVAAGPVAATGATAAQTAAYTALWNAAITLSSGVLNGRVVITLPDGTVVVDTGKGTAVNTYANYMAKAINENHNTRIAIHDAQEYECAEGVETKWSTSIGASEYTVARRLPDGNTYATGYRNSEGTIRLSTT